ncbi:hypothetical protein [Pararhodobacter zhoushanensis]|uniref:Nitrite/Sulfite reductase ferredoxin-like domain-containing protein n=1 Tax=Pararhodobacter zhoushanensis TaxID=2479545 RepID=A0ABT3GVA4_9RHOB|nr:hypothetical protein [Pararhodobacter zhoushanensis]MCW1931463.1 hypothetical protein [Pararhodobacter zhoushanensis]
MSYDIKGWCPGAHRPMMSGDGYVVRVRPRLGEFSLAQALGLCAAAETHGAGLLDVTNRANVQIRGVSETAWPALMADLESLGLLDADADTETRRNIVVAPTWTAQDDTHRLTLELLARLAELPVLPPKMGFAIDAGSGPVLRDTSADFRIERGSDRRLILRADGRALGLALMPGSEIDPLIRLCHWFVDSGGLQAGRMARHSAPLPGWAEGTIAPAPRRDLAAPRSAQLGRSAGLRFWSDPRRRSGPRADRLAGHCPAPHPVAYHRVARCEPRPPRRSQLVTRSARAAGRCLPRRALLPAGQRGNPRAGPCPCPPCRQSPARQRLRQRLRPPRPYRSGADRRKRPL